MFFHPLYSVHKRMLGQKRSERQSLAKDFLRLSNGSRDAAGSNTGEPLKGVLDAQVLQLRREYVSGIPTWPFDTGILTRLTAIILSVIAILVSRVITVSLHI